MKLAQQTAEQYVNDGTYLEIPPSLPPELSLQRACYVCIYDRPGRRLRGMHGHPLPRHPTLAQEIITNTVDAILLHPLGTIGRLDLRNFSYCVAVLGPLQRATVMKHLNPYIYGLYVLSDRGKSAVLLPQRTGIDTAEEQFATALREAGIDTQKESVTMYRFVTDYYE